MLRWICCINEPDDDSSRMNLMLSHDASSWFSRSHYGAFVLYVWCNHFCIHKFLINFVATLQAFTVETWHQRNWFAAPLTPYQIVGSATTFGVFLRCMHSIDLDTSVSRGSTRYLSTAAGKLLGRTDLQPWPLFVRQGLVVLKCRQVWVQLWHAYAGFDRASWIVKFAVAGLMLSNAFL